MHFYKKCGKFMRTENMVKSTIIMHNRGVIRHLIMLKPKSYTEILHLNARRKIKRRHEVKIIFSNYNPGKK